MARLAGVRGHAPRSGDAPDDCWVGPDREGPLFAGVPWVSLGTFYIASLSINAALLARAEDRPRPAHRRHPVRRRARHHPRRMAEGREAGDPQFPDLGAGPTRAQGLLPGLRRAVDPPLGAAARLRAARRGERDAQHRRGQGTEAGVVPDHDHAGGHAAAARIPDGRWPRRSRKYTADEWTALAAEVGTPVQKVRSPEEALLDEAPRRRWLRRQRSRRGVRHAARGRPGHRLLRARVRAPHRGPTHRVRTGPRCWPSSRRRRTRAVRRPGDTGKLARLAARRHHGARPRPRRRGPLRHPGAGPARRARDQGDHADRQVLVQQPHRHVLQP